jgi:hypothetical protein
MKQLGFGCMRLPMIGGAEGEVDQAEFNRMIDRYMQAGFCYFDTAHVYLGGKSELALRDGLVKRYPRGRFLLTDKLSGSCITKEADILPFFAQQLEACGVDYFDYYLMHSQTAQTYAHFMRCNAYEVVKGLKADGKIRHIGISFHDKPAVLAQILTEHPEIEVVQIQLNYLDYDSPSIESGAVYDVCRQFGKPVLVMEPVKGGALADLPEEAEACLAALGGSSPASYALRYAASFDGVFMVLSGMSNDAQMADNLATMAQPAPLSASERDTIEQVRQIIRQQNSIPCTACRYCTPGCPMHIRIPDLFACLNTKRRYQDWGSDYYYSISTSGSGSPADCIHCGQCERICPQHLPIPKLLEEVAAEFTAS